MLVGFVGLVEGDFDVDHVVVGGNALGHDQGELFFADSGGGGIEADDVDGVLREALADEGGEGHGDFFGGGNRP